jgi:hypothetical protein
MTNTTLLPRDLAGRFGGFGAFQAKTPAPTTMFTKLARAEPNLRLALTSAIEHLVEIGDAPEGAPVPAMVIAASPGAGKSRIARELLGHLAGNKRIVFHAPTLALSEEAAEHAQELEGKVHIIRGRAAPDPTTSDEKMCRKYQLVERAIRLGLSIRESFCEQGDARCPHADSCAYLNQFAVTNTVGHRYMATSYLGFPDTDKYGGILRVVDETFWAQQLSFVTISIDAFRLPRTFLRHYTQRGRKEDWRVEAHAELLTAAHTLIETMMLGQSPLELSYTEEEYRAFARLEYSAQANVPAPEPDQSDAQQSRLLARGEDLLRNASWYAAVWTSLADAKQRTRTTTERLRLVNGHSGYALRVCRVRPQRHKQPMLILDADADLEILDALGIEAHRSTNMVLRPHADIVQIHDRRMTLGSLNKGPELREGWRRVIRREVLADQMGQGGGVLVGCSRKVALRFFEDAGHNFSGLRDEEVSQRMLHTQLHGAHWLWYGGRALGTNRYRGCSTVIAIGREELPVEALEDYGRALWGDREDANLEFIRPDASGQLRLPEVEVPYEMSDGSAVAVQIPCHPDPLIRRVQLQTRELATRQLVERLRLARSKTRKRVILGCNIPIPGLPVDELVSWQEFRPTRLAAALIDGLTVKGGLRLSGPGLVEDAPALFTSLDAAKAYRKRCGIEAADVLSSLPAQIRDHLHIIELQQARPYARSCTALIKADSALDALRRAEEIWGPLSTCTCEEVLSQTVRNIVPIQAGLKGHITGTRPGPSRQNMHSIL